MTYLADYVTPPFSWPEVFRLQRAAVDTMQRFNPFTCFEIFAGDVILVHTDGLKRLYLRQTF